MNFTQRAHERFDYFERVSVSTDETSHYAPSAPSREYATPANTNRKRSSRVEASKWRYLSLIYWVWTRVRGDLVPEHIQIQAEDHVHDLDNPTEEEEVAEPRKHSKAHMLLVNECKQAIPGIMRDNEANRLVAHAFLSKRMKENNWRTSDIQRWLPASIELVFLPDVFQVAAKQMRSSHAFVDRRREYQKQPVSRDAPWVLNWWGSVNSAPPTDRS